MEKPSVESVGKWKWRKDWEGPFSFLVCDMSTPPYYHESFAELGTNTDKVLLTCRDGVVTCFLSHSGDEKFGKDLAAQAEQDSGILGTWSARVKSDYDGLCALMDVPVEKLLEEQHLLAYVKAMRVYCAYLGALKTVVNHLSAELLKKNEKVIFDARAYTEDFFLVRTKKMMEEIGRYIGKNEGYDALLMEWLTMNELLAYVRTGELPAKEKLAQRFQRSAFLYTEQTEEFSPEETEAIEKMIYAGDEDNLSGNGNRLGVVRGTAHLILDFQKEKDSFKKGEILVTGMTDPNYVPLMKAAAAIVTDQGGILSHAAIVSRELGIPCVIGTERATRTIKTGDMVEVDGDAGTVRVIKRI